MVLENTLESPLDSKEIKPVNPKEINPEYSLEGLMLNLKLQYFCRLMQRAGSPEKTLMLGRIEGLRRRGWQRMKWLDGITDWMDMSLSKLQEIVKDMEACYAAADRVTKSWTWLSDWTTKRNGKIKEFPMDNFQGPFADNNFQRNDYFTCLMHWNWAFCHWT